MKFKVNQPDGTPAEVSAQNKTIAYKKLKEWLGNRFTFTMRDVYKIITIVILLTSATTFAQDKKQCAGITKAGTQCKHKTATTYCKVHDPASPRCGEKTKEGHPCKVIVKEVGMKCRNHNETKPTTFYNAYSPDYDEYFVIKSYQPLPCDTIVNFDDKAMVTNKKTGLKAKIISLYTK